MGKIITISREFGSGGHFIGEQLAKKLDVPFYDRQIIEKIEEETGFAKDFIEKQGEYSPSKNFFSYGFIGRDTSGVSIPDKIYEVQSKIIKELAKKEDSFVIIGRCADYILKDKENSVHIFIHGNEDIKQERIEKLYNKSPNQAASLMNEMDKKRKLHYGYYTNREWGKISNYTLTLNSSVLGFEKCVELISMSIEKIKK